eukprot:CAMPEP_0183790040 /NCGR_PEP_ID=MMETSP0803_2-20130417/775_1 /TAXON_ID=195967 /ORGANISM="Crustomastix stigmata, Strain CCMP3273" /LENGTH=1665 /DNA_ID=CAMNT_0026034229 /DNA_START=270 /DNA_END=5267 /DNA_ORIENTATION=+
MESEKYICVREAGTAGNQVVMINMLQPDKPERSKISAESVLMNPVSKVIALKASIPNTTTQDSLQIFNLEMKSKMKSHNLLEKVEFWTWISATTLGIVTSNAVYHWSVEGASKPEKVFERGSNLANNQIISYRSSSNGKWLVLIGLAAPTPENPKQVSGNLQLFSVDQTRSQNLEAHAAAFASVPVPGRDTAAQLIAFCTKPSKPTETAKLNIIELGAAAGQTGFQKRQHDLFFPPEFADDFPVALQVSEKYGLVYVITKLGLLFVFDLYTATAVYRNRISAEPVFLTSNAPSSGGFYVINRHGQVLLGKINEQTIVDFISKTLSNVDLALSVAQRGNLPGADQLVLPKFQDLFNSGNYKGAAELAADSPLGILRTRDTISKFQAIPVQPGQTSPLLQYFGICLAKGQLNSFEAVELARLVISQNKKHLLENWLKDDKLECSEELGDLLASTDQDLALRIYIKGKASAKVVQALVLRGEIEKMGNYCSQVGYQPNWVELLQRALMNDGQAAVTLAIQISQQEQPPLDLNQIVELFMQRQMVREATSFLLDVLKPDLAEHSHLQTKVLEINLMMFPNVADAILTNGMLTHYDRPRIAQLCEKAGLYIWALQHYTELADLKRVVVNTPAIEPQKLVEFFGTLSREWALECLKELLQVNLRQNLQTVVQIAKEYTAQLQASAIIELFEEFKSYEGLYFYLGNYIAFSEEPQVHFKYIEAAARTGQIKEVERITRESNVYDPEATKTFLMEAKLPDARPLMNVCDRYGFVHDLTTYLFNNNMMRYIEGYVQKVNPTNAPVVVGALLDVECNEEFIKNLILSVRSLLPVGPLTEEVEKRNRLKLLSSFLEHLVSEGSQDPMVHNALAKIVIDSNNNPEHFLTTNQFYDSRIVGKYCEKRDPNLACVVYKRGSCDLELVDVTNKNSLFKLQARYVVERMDQDLWAAVLEEQNNFRRSLIDQVVSTALPESKNPEQVSVTVKAFMAADLPHELIELLEKIVLQNSAFSNNPNLQNLLVLTAIKADKTRVMEYVNRLDSFDGPAVGEIAVGSELYEEAFAIYKKFGHNLAAIKVLIDYIGTIDRAHEFATKVDESDVWSALANAQTACGHVSEAITSYIKAGDTSEHISVIEAAVADGCFEDLVKFLRMVRKKVKEVRVDTELVYALARINQLNELEEFLSNPNSANLQMVGDRCFDESLYEAAKLLFTSTSSWGRLASTLVRLHQFQQAVDAARKMNNTTTWKEVCFACVEEGEFKLAQLCGHNIIIHADELDEISDYYQNMGHFNELISLIESGLGLERAHMGIFTELGTLYAKFKPEKLMEHLQLFATRINIPKLLRVCEECQHWKELAYLYVQYDEYDNAALVMLMHASKAWEHVKFKDVAVKVANVDIYYKGISFYLEEHPGILVDLLTVLTPRIDHARVVDIMRKANHLALIKSYLLTVQNGNIVAVNEAVNDLAIEEEDFDSLRSSVDMYDNFDQISLAQRCERHELIEFRRVASHIYKRNQRWRQSVTLSKKDLLFKDAMETCANSGDQELAEELLSYFVEQQNKECFAACLYTCYELIRPDIVLELAWTNGMLDFAMPFMVQFVRDYISKVDQLLIDKQEAKEAEETQAKEAAEQNQMYQQLLPPALPAPVPYGGQLDPQAATAYNMQTFPGSMPNPGVYTNMM